MRPILLALPLLQTLCVFGASPVLRDIPANTWYEVPDSKISDVWAGSHGFPFVGSSYGLFSWSGGAFDNNRERFVLWGGGHTDYAGNEIYVFDLDSLKWQRLTDPSTPPPAPQTLDILGDSTPGSRHTYDGLAYISHADRLFSMGGSLWNQGGGSHLTWTFDFQTEKWQVMNPVQTNFTGSAEGYFAYCNAADYDSVTRNVYLETVFGFFAYNYDANTLTKVHEVNGGDWTGDKIGVVDPVRRLFVSVTRSGLTRIYHLDASPVTMELDTAIAYPGGLFSGGGPGAAYDPTTGTIVIWNNQAVGRLDIEQRSCALIGASWTSSVTADTGNSLYAMTFGRFAYIPSADAFMAVPSSISANVGIFKNGPGGAAAEAAGAGNLSALCMTTAPNPATSRIDFQVKGSVPKGAAFKIYDVRGALVADLSERMRSGKTHWNIRNAAAGLYLARLSSGKQAIQERFMIMK